MHAYEQSKKYTSYYLLEVHKKTTHIHALEYKLSFVLMSDIYALYFQTK
jgi:hypothetical protein